jgi:hypothetical protein
VRSSLCVTLLNILTHGLQKSDSVFVKLKSGTVAHFWDIVLYCSISKEPVSKQFALGYDIPSLVTTVNELVNSSANSPLLSRQDLATRKFEYLVCYCLKYVFYVHHCILILILL